MSKVSPKTRKTRPFYRSRNVGDTAKGFLWLVGVVGFLLAGNAAGESFAPLRNLEAFVAEHKPALLGITIAAAVIGFLLSMGGILHMILYGGQPMDAEGVEALQARGMVAHDPLVARRSAYRIAGFTFGGEAHDEWHLRDMKTAWRTGDWRRDPLWRRRFIVFAGAFVMAFGLFGVVFVLGPAGVKLLVGGALLYVLLRTLWAFWRA